MKKPRSIFGGWARAVACYLLCGALLCAARQESERWAQYQSVTRLAFQRSGKLLIAVVLYSTRRRHIHVFYHVAPIGEIWREICQEQLSVLVHSNLMDVVR